MRRYGGVWSDERLRNVAVKPLTEEVRRPFERHIMEELRRTLGTTAARSRRAIIVFELPRNTDQALRQEAYCLERWPTGLSTDRTVKRIF
jgi:hypothetical protein